MRPGPLHSDHTRGEHLREVLRGRAVGYGIVGGGALALAVAAAAGASAPVVLLAPVATAIVVVVLAVAVADRRAADEFFASLARSIGFVLHGESDEPHAFTPLLAAGDVRKLTRVMTGRLDGHATKVGHYSWYTVSKDRDGRTSRGPRRAYTVVIVDLEPEGVPWCSGLYLHPRQALGGFLSEGWLPGDLDTIETESSAVRERYVLRAERDVEPLRIRELFSPTLLDRLARDPARPAFEYRAGVLVVFEEGHAQDAGSFVALLDATRAIAERISSEATEAREASVPPPGRAA